MSEDARQSGGGARRADQGYAPGDNAADPKEHRHGNVVHSHDHTGPHEHGDDYEYDEAHDPEMLPPRERGLT